MSLMNKAKQVLFNEQRKIKTKIDFKRREIVKLEAELSEIDELLKK